jgi:hypothetical protein
MIREMVRNNPDAPPLLDEQVLNVANLVLAAGWLPGRVVLVPGYARVLRPLAGYLDARAAVPVEILAANPLVPEIGFFHYQIAEDRTVRRMA